MRLPVIAEILETRKKRTSGTLRTSYPTTVVHLRERLSNALESDGSGCMLIDMSGTNRSRVAAKFLDGSVVKGYALDFAPNRSVFHVRPLDPGPRGDRIAIQISQLKALFFVKDLTTTSRTGCAIHPSEAKTPPSMRRVVVEFSDGEVLAGATCGYSPDRQGFFLVPLNPTTNNVRVFVVSSSVKAVRVLELNEDLQQVLSEMETDKSGMLRP